MCYLTLLSSIVQGRQQSQHLPIIRVDNILPILLFSFLMGLVCSMTMSSAIEAGVSTIFVGLGEDPQVLSIRAPSLFAVRALV